MSFLTKILGDSNKKFLKKLEPIVSSVNALEEKMKSLTDEGLKSVTSELRNRLDGGQSLDDILPEAFAATREVSRRTLGQRHFDVQLLGGIILHQGKIAEMRTGEGKTLVATLPAYLNAISGQGVHVVTVNDYLSRRDAVWMGQIYNALGLTVGCTNHEASYIYDSAHRSPVRASESDDKLDKERDITGAFHVVHEFLKPCSRKEAYAADITYGTNNEFGFDYLRDNIAYNVGDVVQRGYNFAVVDEIDSILIDEARTPLIISAPSADSDQFYIMFSKIAEKMNADEDFIVDEKMKAVSLTEKGIEKAEKALGVGNIYTEKGIKYVHHLETAIRAKALFHLDKDYVVKNNEIIIVDEFTGRMMPGRRWSEGLHQAVEAKEKVQVQKESRTLASITFQNYFRLYGKLAGMTGTALTSAEEFHKVYKLETVSIPTNKPLARRDKPDLVFQTVKGKFQALAGKIKEVHQTGQPILVGTVSIDKNEYLSALLKKEGVPHTVLNAKHHEKEGEIVAQAGRKGGVTIATNMAGRGVDIVLGGNPPVAGEAEEVRKSGGLFVLGTERHEARRIDNQLRGRSGRQGDPGETQFYISLEDDVMRVFGSDRIKGLMGRLGIPEDQPIENRMLSKAIESAQSKIEGFNFDARKHLLEYDDVLNKQRKAIYTKRREMLEKKSHSQIFGVLDFFWMNHLENMEALAESVRLRAYGQHDPLVEYRREGKILFETLLADFNNWMRTHADLLRTGAEKSPADISPPVSVSVPRESASALGKTGRNDPCPCGSGKKYKRCHGQ